MSNRNIRILPGRGTSGSGNEPKIIFTGTQSANTIELLVLDDGSVQIVGSQGTLFGISDDLSGSLLSANDISGLPIFEVFADDTIVGGKYGENTWVVNSDKVGIGVIDFTVFGKSSVL